MRQETREMIRALRLEGWGYKRIATELRLKRDDVRLYCLTHGLGGQGKYVKLNYPIWNDNNDRCRVCGKKLELKRRGRKRHFCSGRCRTIYCRTRKEMPDADEAWTEDFPGWDGAEEW